MSARKARNKLQSRLGKDSVKNQVLPVGDLRDSSELAPAFKRFSAAHNARPHLLAYVHDRNPEHVFDAFREYLKLGVPLSEAMMRNLDHALRERHKRPSGNPKRTTLRDVRIAMYISAKHGSIPARVPQATLREIAVAQSISVPAAKQVVSRLRLFLKDAEYYCPRAFR